MLEDKNSDTLEVLSLQRVSQCCLAAITWCVPILARAQCFASFFEPSLSTKQTWLFTSVQQHA